MWLVVKNQCSELRRKGANETPNWPFLQNMNAFWPLLARLHYHTQSCHLNTNAEDIWRLSEAVRGRPRSLRWWSIGRRTPAKEPDFRRKTRYHHTRLTVYMCMMYANIRVRGHYEWLLACFEDCTQGKRTKNDTFETFLQLLNILWGHFCIKIVHVFILYCSVFLLSYKIFHFL